MNKKTSIIMAIMILISISLAVVPAVNADASFHAVYGKVRINGEIAPAGVEIQIEVPELGFTTLKDTTDVDENGYNFYAGFNATFTDTVVYFNLPSATTGAYSITLNGTGEPPADVAKYYMNLNFTTTTNNPPYEPSDPTPADSATDVGRNADLGWTGGDPDGDPVTYDVYFGIVSPPPQVTTGQGETTYDPGEMTFSTTYYWQIVAWDNQGAHTDGPIWSFTTSAVNRPPNKPILNSPADGSTLGSETSATLKVDVTDPDGDTMDVKFYNANGDAYIGEDTGVTDGGTASFTWSGRTQDTTYQWYAVADDGEYINQSITWSFTTKEKPYNPPGDGDGDSDGDGDGDDEEILPNNPPTRPTVNGTQDGTKQTNYTYTAISTDPDDDNINYTFDWGDGTNSSSGYVANNTMVNATHQWAAAGVYQLSAQAWDDYETEENGTPSGITNYTVLIDVLWVKDIGYILNNDTDSIYETFYSNETEDTTTTEYNDTNGTYLINSDGVEGWDWVYDPVTDTLTEYVEGNGETTPDETPEEEDNTILYMLGLGMIIVIAILIGIYLVTKKKETPKKPKKK